MFVVKTKLDIIYDTLNHSFWLIEAHLIEQILIAGLRNTRGFPGSTGGKEPAYQCRIHKRHGFNPWVRKIP